jgi:YfiH family protein
MMRFGDCTPVLLFDPVRQAIGLAHAGWRGVVAGVVGASIRTMAAHFGSIPGDMWAGIGPTIGPCCYEVGADVAGEIASACPPGSEVVHSVNSQVHADLPAAVEAQLRAAGVEWIEHADLCTSCRVDEFFSHRAEDGKTGRFGVVIGLEHG